MAKAKREMWSATRFIVHKLGVSAPISEIKHWFVERRSTYMVT